MLTQRAYAVLRGEDSEDRLCADIPDAACTNLPRNYLLNVANGAATKLAEQLASPGLVLAWALAAIGAPAALVGFLAPLKQVGALLPQLLVAGRIRMIAIRKRVWSAAGLTQALLLAAMIPAFALPPAAAGLAVLCLFGLFAFVSGVGSVAFQDVMGKTIPKGRRGRLLASRATIGGILTLIAGLLLRLVAGEGAGIVLYLVLIGAAALLWALGAALFAAVAEDPGATEGGRSALAEAGRGVGLLRSVPGYRRYLMARSAMVSVEIAMPIFALHAHALFGGSAGALGTYILAVGAANILSSPLWGRASDASARGVMIAAGLVAAAAGALALALGALGEEARAPWMYAAIFLILGVAEAGARLGRKTYLVDGAPADDRPLYVAFGNSLVGTVTLALGGLGLVAQLFGPGVGVLALSGLALLGAALSARMPEAARMSDRGALTKA